MEAIDQSPQVQYTIICSLYNRIHQGMSLGSQGYDRLDRNEFIKHQPQNIKNGSYF